MSFIPATTKVESTRGTGYAQSVENVTHETKGAQTRESHIGQKVTQSTDTGQKVTTVQTKGAQAKSSTEGAQTTTTTTKEDFGATISFKIKIRNLMNPPPGTTSDACC